MEYTNRRMQEMVIGQMVCPGTPQYSKFHRLVMDYLQEQEKELKRLLAFEQENWNDAKEAYYYSKNRNEEPTPEVNDSLTYSNGRKKILFEILGNFTNSKTLGGHLIEEDKK